LRFEAHGGQNTKATNIFSIKLYWACLFYSKKKNGLVMIAYESPPEKSEKQESQNSAKKRGSSQDNHMLLIHKLSGMADIL
jgi:hypothetical protein